MKFIADVMLGKLAKWLRVAGINVLYSNSNNDETLIKICRTENRTLLTRDRRLAVDKRLKVAIIIENELLDRQLKEFFVKTRLMPGEFFSRCLICNEELISIPEKEAIKDKIPSYTYRTHEEFSICLKCDKIYWKGTHRDNMLKMLETITNDASAQSRKR